MRSNSSVVDQFTANGSGGACGASDTALMDAAGSEASKAVAVLVKVQAVLGCGTDEVIFVCSKKVTVSDRHSTVTLERKSDVTAVYVTLA